MRTSRNLPIGVFDSGVGGLSILKELQRLLPKEDFIFLADQTNVPYGEKSPKQLQKIGVDIAHFFKSQNIKLLVIACNTATCYAAETLRKRFDFPIVGTVPAIKQAAARSRTKVIAVLSTPATAKSTTVKELALAHGLGVAILPIGCFGLEDAVETGALHSALTMRLIKKYVGPLKHYSADQIVLGCTHYPFLRNTIQKIAGPDINLVDSGVTIANETKRILKAEKLLSSLKSGATIYFTTGNPQRFGRVASKLMQTQIKAQRAHI